MELGQALQESGHRSCIALANDAFADGPNATRKTVRGDFDSTQALDGTVAMQTRRYGQAGNTAVTKGTLEGSERHPQPEELAPWVAAAYPQVDPKSLNLQAVLDVFFVESLNGGETVYATEYLPFQLANGGKVPETATDGSTGDPALAAKVEALESALARHKAATLGALHALNAKIDKLGATVDGELSATEKLADAEAALIRPGVTKAHHVAPKA